MTAQRHTTRCCSLTVQSVVDGGVRQPVMPSYKRRARTHRMLEMRIKNAHTFTNIASRLRPRRSVLDAPEKSLEKRLTTVAKETCVSNNNKSTSTINVPVREQEQEQRQQCEQQTTPAKAIDPRQKSVITGDDRMTIYPYNPLPSVASFRWSHYQAMFAELDRRIAANVSPFEPFDTWALSADNVVRK